jgi:hypothetical protein
MSNIITINGEPVIKTNRSLFLAVYGEQLGLARVSNPQDYPWPASELPAVLARMAAALDRGSFNKDGRALRATCKYLGIKHTYGAINEFINKEGE